MTASTTSFNACTDPYNEDLQADQLTLSISVHRAAAPERVEVTARGRASRASTRTCRASPPTSRLVAILRRLAAPVRPWCHSVSASLWMLGAAVEGEKSGPIKKAAAKAANFSKSAAARRGMRCALLTCEVPVELVTPNWSNKLVEDSAGRLRPTAAARMNGNS